MYLRSSVSGTLWEIAKCGAVGRSGIRVGSVVISVGYVRGQGRDGVKLPINFDLNLGYQF